MQFSARIAFKRKWGLRKHQINNEKQKAQDLLLINRRQIVDLQRVQEYVLSNSGTKICFLNFISPRWGKMMLANYRCDLVNGPTNI